MGKVPLRFVHSRGSALPFALLSTRGPASTATLLTLLRYTDLGALETFAQWVLLLQMQRLAWARSWPMGRTRSKHSSKWWKTSGLFLRVGHTAGLCLCNCFFCTFYWLLHHFTSLISLSCTETVKGKNQIYSVCYIIIMALVLVWEWSLTLTYTTVSIYTKVQFSWRLQWCLVLWTCLASIFIQVCQKLCSWIHFNVPWQCSFPGKKTSRP